MLEFIFIVSFIVIAYLVYRAVFRPADNGYDYENGDKKDQNWFDKFD